MKQLLLQPLLILVMITTSFASPFITTWEVKEDKKLCFKLKGKAKISWYKKYDTNTKGKAILDKENCISLPDTGIYVVEIEKLIGLKAVRSHSLQLLSLDQWGTSKWQELDSVFFCCKKMQGLAKDVPNLKKVKSLAHAFDSAIVFNQNINNWDVSNVTDMSYTFAYAKNFNQPLNNWDVSKVTSMLWMFGAATNFNQPLDRWDVSNVTTTSNMFPGTQFNHNINNWDVSNVTDMSAMFAEAWNYNQPLDQWDVSNVTNMSQLFYSCVSFNQPLATWKVSNVTNMKQLFLACRKFNQPLSSWDITKVRDVSQMFTHASSFNQSLSSWDLIGKEHKGIFYGAEAFDFDKNMPIMK